MSVKSIFNVAMASHQMLPGTGPRPSEEEQNAYQGRLPFKGLTKQSQADTKTTPKPIQSQEGTCNGVQDLCRFQPHQVYWHGANGAGTESHQVSSQTQSVGELLKNGVRALKIEIYASKPRDQEKFGAVQIRESGLLWGLGKSAHQDVLKEVAKFLAENPREVVMISYVSHVEDWRALEKELETAGLIDKIYDVSAGQEWTLGEMVQEDKRLMLFFENRFAQARGRKTKRHSDYFDQNRPALFQDSEQKGLVKESAYGRMARQTNLCHPSWGKSSAPYSQLNLWDTALPRERDARRLADNDYLPSSLYGVLATCRDAGNSNRLPYNVIFTNHTHLGPGDLLIQGLNRALVEQGDLAQALGEARQSYRDQQTPPAPPSEITPETQQAQSN